MHIDQYGNINPCVFLGQGFIAENIYQDKIKNIWTNGKSFQEMRNISMNEDCYSCERQYVCHNECPAIKLNVNGSLGGMDPGCLKT